MGHNGRLIYFNVQCTVLSRGLENHLGNLSYVVVCSHFHVVNKIWVAQNMAYKSYTFLLLLDV